MKAPMVKPPTLRNKPVKLVATERKAFLKNAVALGVSTGLTFGHPQVSRAIDFSLRESFETPISIVKPS